MIAVVVQMTSVCSEDQNIRIVRAIAGLEGIDVGHDHRALATSQNGVGKLELHAATNAEPVDIQWRAPDVFHFDILKILDAKGAARRWREGMVHDFGNAQWRGDG